MRVNGDGETLSHRETASGDEYFQTGGAGIFFLGEPKNELSPESSVITDSLLIFPPPPSRVSREGNCASASNSLCREQGLIVWGLGQQLGSRFETGPSAPSIQRSKFFPDVEIRLGGRSESQDEMPKADLGGDHRNLSLKLAVPRRDHYRQDVGQGCFSPTPRSKGVVPPHHQETGSSIRD